MWNNRPRSTPDPGYVSDRGSSGRRGRDRSRSPNRYNDHRNNDNRSKKNGRNGGGGGRSRDDRDSDRGRSGNRDRRRSDRYSNDTRPRSRSRPRYGAPVQVGQVGHQNFNPLNAMEVESPALVHSQNVPDRIPIPKNRSQNGNNRKVYPKNSGGSLDLIINSISDLTSISDTSPELIPYSVSNVRSDNNKILFYSGDRSGRNRNQDKLALAKSKRRSTPFHYIIEESFEYTQWNDVQPGQPNDDTPLCNLGNIDPQLVKIKPNITKEFFDNALRLIKVDPGRVQIRTYGLNQRGNLLDVTFRSKMDMLKFCHRHSGLIYHE